MEGVGNSGSIRECARDLRASLRFIFRRVPSVGPVPRRAAPWQRIIRIALVPVTVGLIIASGSVMAYSADAGWQAAAVTVAAAAVMLQTRFSPILMILIGGVLGGLGLL
jgi:chromate transport protein ChrA